MPAIPLRPIVKQKRKIFAAVVLLTASAGWFVVFRITHRHDPLIVGTWVESTGRWATQEELQLAANREKLYARRRSPFRVWSLRADGTGNVTKIVMPGEGACRWYTSGDRLFIQYDSRALTMREKLFEWWWAISGEQPKRWHAYRFVVDGSDQVRVDIGDPRFGKSHSQLHLTRIVSNAAR